MQYTTHISTDGSDVIQAGQGRALCGQSISWGGHVPAFQGPTSSVLWTRTKSLPLGKRPICKKCTTRLAAAPARNDAKNARRREWYAALVWWRAQHPEYADRKRFPARMHRWYGLAVFGTPDGLPIARHHEIMAAYQAQLPAAAEVSS